MYSYSLNIVHHTLVYHCLQGMWKPAIHTANTDKLLLPHFGLRSLFFQLAAIKLNSNIETICAAPPLTRCSGWERERGRENIDAYRGVAQFELSPVQPIEWFIDFECSFSCQKLSTNMSTSVRVSVCESIRTSISLSVFFFFFSLAALSAENVYKNSFGNQQNVSNCHLLPPSPPSASTSRSALTFCARF